MRRWGLGSAALLARICFFFYEQVSTPILHIIQKEKCWCWHPEQENKGLVQRKNVHTGKVKALMMRRTQIPFAKIHLQYSFRESAFQYRVGKSRGRTFAITEIQNNAHSWSPTMPFKLCIWPASYPVPSAVCTIHRQSVWHYHLKMSYLNIHASQRLLA